MCVSTSRNRDAGGPDQRRGQPWPLAPPNPGSGAWAFLLLWVTAEPLGALHEGELLKKEIFPPQKKGSGGPAGAGGASRGVPAASATQRRRAALRASPGAGRAGPAGTGSRFCLSTGASSLCGTAQGEGKGGLRLPIGGSDQADGLEQSVSQITCI